MKKSLYLNTILKKVFMQKKKLWNSQFYTIIIVYQLFYNNNIVADGVPGEREIFSSQPICEYSQIYL